MYVCVVFMYSACVYIYIHIYLYIYIYRGIIEVCLKIWYPQSNEISSCSSFSL